MTREEQMIGKIIAFFREKGFETIRDVNPQAMMMMVKTTISDGSGDMLVRVAMCADTNALELTIDDETFHVDDPGAVSIMYDIVMQCKRDYRKELLDRVHAALSSTRPK